MANAGERDRVQCDQQHRIQGRGSLALVLSLATALGCHEHVALNAPSSSAPIEERASAYNRLHPLSMHETHITYLHGGVPVGAARQVDYLQLADGKRVYYPEDLIPVVEPNGPTAQAAERSESARKTSYTLKGIGAGTIVLGGVIMISPLLQSRDPGESMSMTPIWTGAAVMLAGGLLSLIGGVYSGKAHDEASTAFETYDSSLKANLGLYETAPSVEARPRRPAGRARRASPVPAEDPAAAQDKEQPPEE